jgi:hypothetical protein
LFFALRAGQVWQVVECDPEIDVGQDQIWVKVECASESIRGFFIFELLEQRDAEIIRPISFFATGAGLGLILEMRGSG